jgi:hypothetical protein
VRACVRVRRGGPDRNRRGGGRCGEDARVAYIRGVGKEAGEKREVRHGEKLHRRRGSAASCKQPS